MKFKTDNLKQILSKKPWPFRLLKSNKRLKYKCTTFGTKYLIMGNSCKLYITTATERALEETTRQEDLKTNTNSPKK